MLRLIAREYVAGLWRSGKGQANKVMGIFWVIYAVTVLPALWGCYDTWIGAGLYLSIAIPMLWCAIESMLSPIQMTKLLFLCPMDETMRRKYIRGTYYFKVLVHTTLGVVGAFLSLLLGNDWLGMLGVSFNMLVFALLNVGIDGAGEPLENNDFDTSNWGRLAVRIIGDILVVLLQMIYMSAAESGGLLAQARGEQILIGCITAVTVLFAAKYVTYWKVMQEEALCYEKSIRDCKTN